MAQSTCPKCKGVMYDTGVGPTCGNHNLFEMRCSKCGHVCLYGETLKYSK